MYELYTLGGGTYLVDLLNAVAAITSGGAYLVLAQLVRCGWSRLGAAAHRLRGIMGGERQMDTAVHHRLGRDDRALKRRCVWSTGLTRRSLLRW